MLAWTRTNDGREWIVYSAPTGDSRSLFRVAISTRGELGSKPEQLTSGTGLIQDAALSDDGKLAFASASLNEQIYAIPTIVDRGVRLEEARRVTFTEGLRNHSPSVSRDGRWLAYAATNQGNNQTVVRLKDFSTGSDRLVTDRAHPYASDIVSISPDGSHVVFCRLDGAYVVPSEGGTPERISVNCDPRGFSSDGSRVLMQQIVNGGLDYIVAVDLASKTVRKFLSHVQWQLYHSFFSWDDQWVVFKRMIDLKHGQLLIAPVRNGEPGDEAEWVAATDGHQNDDKPQFSPDGNTLYFTSDRDGFRCVWALRLNHATKRPEGRPFAIQHFHNPRGSYSLAYHSGGVVLSVARDKILTNLVEPHGDIWLVQVD